MYNTIASTYMGISLLCFYFHLYILLSGNSFSDLIIMLIVKILPKVLILCSKLSYIASYLTVTSYKLYTSTAYTVYTHHGEL